MRQIRRFHAIFMPVIIEFSRCIGTYLSAKFELILYIVVVNRVKCYIYVENPHDYEIELVYFILELYN